MLLELNDIRPSNDLSGTENKRRLYLSVDANGREVWLTRLHDVQFAGPSAFYPDVTLHSAVDNTFYTPIREKTMSLSAVVAGSAARLIHTADRRHEGPVFFFIYNTDNYYHYIYDTLPYLMSFLELQKTIPELRLLMNYPNSQAQTFYKFVLEFLELFDLTQDTLVLANMNTRYTDVYLSSSYSHDHDSDAAPRREIHEFYRNMVETAARQQNAGMPRRIYISRRTWLHGDFSNIGTNYTTRRRLENEDALMELLSRHGFIEVFTENLSTLEKLELFSHAETVVGALGGGVCNVLFSQPKTKLLCLISPTFLDVNARFSHCLNQVQLTWFDQTAHVETGRFKRFMRVNCPSQGIVGEITEVHADSLTVAYTQEKVAGWNAQNAFLSATLPMADCEPLDAGLNSAWRIDLEAFERCLLSML